jgi:hypothetical protein
LPACIGEPKRHDRAEATRGMSRTRALYARIKSLSNDGDGVVQILVDRQNRLRICSD